MAELLHEKIYNDILNKIRAHQYEEGDMLPPESEMELIYSVSKAPIRQALTRLVKDGFIIRKAGKGTFVSGRVNWPYPNMGGHAKEFAEKGKLLHCRTLAISQTTLSSREAAYMQQAVGTAALYVERVRFYEDEPIHHLEHYILETGIVDLKEKLQQEGNFSSLLALYDKYGITIGETNDELEAVSADERIADKLKISQGTPVLLINRNTYKADGALLEYVRFYILTKNWKYRAHYVGH